MARLLTGPCFWDRNSVWRLEWAFFALFGVHSPVGLQRYFPPGEDFRGFPLWMAEVLGAAGGGGGAGGD